MHLKDFYEKTTRKTKQNIFEIKNNCLCYQEGSYFIHGKYVSTPTSFSFANENTNLLLLF